MAADSECGEFLEGAKMDPREFECIPEPDTSNHFLSGGSGIQEAVWNCLCYDSRTQKQPALEDER